MERNTPVLLLSLVSLLIGVAFCQQQANGETNDKKQISQKSNVATSISNTKATEAKQTDVEGGKNGKTEEEPAAYFRIVPACACVMIFVGGSLAIFIWEKQKERKKKQEDIDAMEDEELSNEWIENLRNRQRRKSVFQRVRTMSFHGVRTKESNIDSEKARKYKIYDEMLDKYWQTLDVLRKGARTGQKEDKASRTARLKELAQLHQTMSTTEKDKDVTSDSAEDQYTIMIREAKLAAAHGNSIESVIEEEEEPVIDPAKLHQRRRSSRFHKQSEVIIDDDDDGANDRIKLRETSGLSQSYVASDEQFVSPAGEPQANEIDHSEELLNVLEKITPREMSAIQRLQVKMRPKSLIENLAARHRESVAMASSMTALHTSSLYENPMPSPKHVSSVPSIGMGRKRVSDKVGVPPNENTKGLGVTARGKQRLRSRPMSMYDTGVTKNKISNKRLRSRPASLFIPHTIEEDKPSIQIIDIDSLQNLQDYSLSAADEDHMMATLEQQLIADVCEENELSKDEIKALENLLDDVVTYSKENLIAEPKRKITKQYSLLSVQSTSSLGSKQARPDLSAQLSFTDSVSLFGDIEEDHEEDKSEETVLMSLMGASSSKAANRSSLSNYDNN